jgi:hypothetical protein
MDSPAIAGHVAADHLPTTQSAKADERGRRLAATLLLFRCFQLLFRFQLLQFLSLFGFQLFQQGLYPCLLHPGPET